MRHSRTIIAALVACTLAGLTTSATQAQTTGACTSKSTTRKPPTTHRTTVRIAKVSAYCSHCSSKRTCASQPLRAGTVAADLHYHPLGTRIAFGPPINRTLVVADTGGAIKGRDRFDRSYGVQSKCRADVQWGKRWVAYRVVGR